MAKLRIQELRKLMMPLDTAVDAVLELDRSHGGTLALGTLLDARIDTGAEPGLCLVVQGTGIPAATQQRRYTLPAVAAALIHYCFRCRIPLPRQATKSIEIIPEGFMLVIQTAVETPRLHGPLPSSAGTSAAAAATPATAAAGDAAAAAVGEAATTAAAASTAAAQPVTAAGGAGLAPHAEAAGAAGAAGAAAAPAAADDSAAVQEQVAAVA